MSGIGLGLTLIRHMLLATSLKLTQSFCSRQWRAQKFSQEELCLSFLEQQNVRTAWGLSYLLFNALFTEDEADFVT